VESLEELIKQRNTIDSRRNAVNAKIASALGLTSEEPSTLPAAGAGLKRKAKPDNGRVQAMRDKRHVVPKAPKDKAEKRSEGDIAHVKDVLLGALKGGSKTSEEIQQATGLTKKDIVLPLKKLVKDGLVTTTGQKRSTRYSA
jgi:hypothetical protein